MDRAIEITEKIVREYRNLANKHVAESQSANPPSGCHDPRHQVDARVYRMRLAHDCSLRAEGAEAVLSVLRAEDGWQANRIPGEERRAQAVEAVAVAEEAASRALGIVVIDGKEEK